MAGKSARVEYNTRRIEADENIQIFDLEVDEGFTCLCCHRSSVNDHVFDFGTGYCTRCWFECCIREREGKNHYIVEIPDNCSLYDICLCCRESYLTTDRNVKYCVTCWFTCPFGVRACLKKNSHRATN